MRMTTAKRKPIVCWPETDAEGGVESTSRGDMRKDRQRTVGGKAGVKEISSALRTGGESLSETLKMALTQSAKQPTNQTNKTGKKTTAGQRLGRRGTEEVGYKRGKRAEEKMVKHRTKARVHQVNCLTQRVEDKGRRGGSEGHPSSHLCGAHKDGG
jgi:hypothetical protein